MTPLDVLSQRRDANAHVLRDKNSPNPAEARFVKWEFNKFHDAGSYKPDGSEASFFFKLRANGEIEAGYSPNGRITVYKTRYKNITTLQQIDVLFGLMSPEYK